MSLLAAVVASIILVPRNRHYRRAALPQRVDADVQGLPGVVEPRRISAQRVTNVGGGYVRRSTMYPNLLSAIGSAGWNCATASSTRRWAQDGHRRQVRHRAADQQPPRRVQGGPGNILEVSSVLESASPSKFVSIAHDRYLPMLTRFNEVLHRQAGHRVQSWLAVAVASDPTARILTPSPLPMGPATSCGDDRRGH